VNETFYACGLNSSGQLGLGDTVNRVGFVSGTSPNNTMITSLSTSSSNYTIIQTLDGSIFTCGSNVYTVENDPGNQWVSLVLPGPVTVSNIYVVDSTLQPFYTMNVYNFTSSSWVSVNTDTPLNLGFNRKACSINVGFSSNTYAFKAPVVQGTYSLYELAIYSRDNI